MRPPKKYKLSDLEKRFERKIKELKRERPQKFVSPAAIDPEHHAHGTFSLEHLREHVEAFELLALNLERLGELDEG